MSRLIIFVLTAAFLLDILDLSVDGYRFFRNQRQKSEPSKYERWFTQNLDHFNPNDGRNWQQRYFVNDEFFNDSLKNVAFLEIGGEGEASADWMTNGSWYSYAKDFKAILFQLEHRYYGQSHPTVDVSTENLVYLTSQQALADLAFFIEAMNKKHDLPSNVKWIVFGGSYPGSLAAWVRQKYPHLVHGAMSASGPLLAKLDFPEYLEVVQDALRSSSDECAEAVKDATDQIDVLLQDTHGQKIINTEFHLCDDIQESINNELDISNFYEGLADAVSGVVQYNHDNRAASILLNMTVEKMCDILTDQSIKSPVSRLGAVITLILKSTQQDCFYYKYDQTIDNLKNTSWDVESPGGREWTYQTCTEFGFFQTSTYKPQIFGDKFELNFFIKQCQDIFGPEINKKFLDNAIARTNNLYGGLDIEVSNVVFVHGSLDPWHVLGITKSDDDNAPAILIEGAAHCANMYNPSDNDTPQLKAARTRVQEIIGSWLKL